MVDPLPGNSGASQNTFSSETEWVAMVKRALSLNKPGSHSQKHTHAHIHLDVSGVEYAKKRNAVLNGSFGVIFNNFNVEIIR